VQTQTVADPHEARCSDLHSEPVAVVIARLGDN